MQSSAVTKRGEPSGRMGNAKNTNLNNRLDSNNLSGKLVAMPNQQNILSSNTRNDPILTFGASTNKSRLSTHDDKLSRALATQKALLKPRIRVLKSLEEEDPLAKSHLVLRSKEGPRLEGRQLMEDPKLLK